MQEGTHPTEDRLIARLYGIEDAATRAHLGVCSECLERYEAIERRRALLTGFKPLSSAQLAQQRAAIAARIESRPAFPRWLWAPAAAAMLLGAGLYFWQPPAPAVAEQAPPVAADTAIETIDASWYDEVYGGIDLMEPRAATPIRELFVEEGASE